jgi:DNA repair protein RecO (recombination protein O)
VPERRDEAYVLRTHDLGEADRIVTLLTRDHGRVRAVARSARRSVRRFGGYLEPLSLVRAAWTERGERDLHHLVAVDGLRSHAAMQADPVLQAACAVLAEVSDGFVADGQPDPGAFRLVGAVLDALEAGGDPWTLVRYFEYWTLGVHGLLPSLADCSRCGQPVAETAARATAGGVLCRSCPPRAGTAARALTAADLAFLGAARRLGPAAMGPWRVPSRGGALELLLHGSVESYLERRVRSYRHLRAASAVGEETA